MGTCLEIFVALVLGMLGTRLFAPFWPNQHVYGSWEGTLVDPAGVDLLDKHSLLNGSTVKTVILQFTHE